MRAKSQATIEDLYDVPEKAELVDGEIIVMSPTGGIPGWAGDEIRDSLAAYARRTGLKSIAVSDNKAFIVDLPHRRSFSPDAAFYVGKMSMKFYTGAHIFAVEVRSEGDYGPAAAKEIARKRDDYFAAGTQVVWDVDLLSADVVRVYRKDNPEQPTIYPSGDMAEAEPAVPGWTMPVDELFYRDTDYIEEE